MVIRVMVCRSAMRLVDDDTRRHGQHTAISCKQDSLEPAFDSFYSNKTIAKPQPSCQTESRFRHRAHRLEIREAQDNLEKEKKKMRLFLNS